MLGKIKEKLKKSLDFLLVKIEFTINIIIRAIILK